MVQLRRYAKSISHRGQWLATLPMDQPIWMAQRSYPACADRAQPGANKTPAMCVDKNSSSGHWFAWTRADETTSRARSTAHCGKYRLALRCFCTAFARISCLDGNLPPDLSGDQVFQERIIHAARGNPGRIVEMCRRAGTATYRDEIACGSAPSASIP